MKTRLKRREFITLLGVAAAWPLAASAQHGERMRRIGVLATLPADEPDWQARLAAFLQGLQESGWGVGRNVRIEYRLGADNSERLRRHIAEMVALAPDVILANGTSVVAPLLQATRTLPVVFGTSRIRSAAALSRAWHGPGAMRPGSPRSSTA